MTKQRQLISDIIKTSCKHLSAEEISYDEINREAAARTAAEDGLFFYRRLAKEAPQWLKPGGKIYLEIGYDQGETVPALLREAGFINVTVRKDLAGNDRVVRGEYPHV